MENLINPQRQSSSDVIKREIDLNIQDKELSTPICFAFRQNHKEIIDLLLSKQTFSNKLNLDIVSPKYGCPLHLCILKHKFDLASHLILDKGANPHILNPNGSNSMHILFANYMFDEVKAKALALNIINKGVNINLMDNNGLTPLLVAIKKSQLKAL